MWHYARGVARAVQGDFEAASAEAAAIAKLRDKADLTPLTNAGVPAPDVLRIAELTVQARVAQGQKNLPEATKQFQSAVALQDKLPYMEPPYWYYPARQSLGAVLLQAGDLDGAEQAFRDSLARAPNNGWSLYGLREVYEKRGDQDAMRDTEELLGQTWIGPREELELPRL
jgi:tetratricopeptide (TPR) repeat protein